MVLRVPNRTVGIKKGEGGERKMAKVKMPFLSGGASGDVADSVFYRRRGVETIAGIKVTPANPRTEDQQRNRMPVRELSRRWYQLKGYPQDLAAWDRLRNHLGHGGSAYNEFISRYKRHWDPGYGTGYVRNVIIVSCYWYWQEIPVEGMVRFLHIDFGGNVKWAENVFSRICLGGYPLVPVYTDIIGGGPPVDWFDCNFGYVDRWEFPDVWFWWDAVGSEYHNWWSGLYRVLNIPQGP